MPFVHAHEDSGINFPAHNRDVQVIEQNINTTTTRQSETQSDADGGVKQETSDSHDRSPEFAVCHSSPSGYIYRNGRDCDSLFRKGTPSAEIRALLSAITIRDLDPSSSLEDWEKTLRDLDPPSSLEDSDSTLLHLRSLGSNNHSPFQFPSFINTINLQMGADSVFARMRFNEDCARTSSFLAGRYSRKGKLLPSISTFLSRRTPYPTAHDHQRQTDPQHGPDSQDQSLGEYIAEAAHFASYLLANPPMSSDEEL